MAWLCWRALAASPTPDGVGRACAPGGAGAGDRGRCPPVDPGPAAAALAVTWRGGTAARCWCGHGGTGRHLPGLAGAAGLAGRWPARVPERRPFAARLRGQQDVGAGPAGLCAARERGPGRRRAADRAESGGGAVRARAGAPRAWWGRLSRRHGWMLALWTGPALGVFVVGHIGQVGYLLLVLPAACLLLAILWRRPGERLAERFSMPPGEARPWWQPRWPSRTSRR